MVVNNKKLASQPEILKRKLGGEYFAPVTIAESEFSDKDVVKAGSPINASGEIDNTATAVGILLNDVYKENPNGSLVKGFAVINTANANANAGLSIDGTVKTALSNLIFE